MNSGSNTNNNTNKILLYIYNNDTKFKKYKLETGEYTVGNSKAEAQIVLKDNITISAKHFDISIDDGNKVYLIPLEKKKTLYLNGNLIQNKTKIKNKDEITFSLDNKEKNNYKLIFKIREIERERSRSPPNNKNESDLEVEKEKKNKNKTDNADDTNKHIKSEVIWNSVNFEKPNKKEKFLRLMGAFKGGKKLSEGENQLDEETSKKLSSNFKKIESDLTNQYYQTIGRKYK